ncbi:hypothetical protein J6590_001983 [Homalodisca vitripennis]|nr:hypothetical protein J6590_001983 [Homalodisca vitripennis]
MKDPRDKVETAPLLQCHKFSTGFGNTIASCRGVDTAAANLLAVMNQVVIRRNGEFLRTLGTESPPEAHLTALTSLF